MANRTGSNELLLFGEQSCKNADHHYYADFLLSLQVAGQAVSESVNTLGENKRE